MRVGITGATGFIGRKLIDALRARGDVAVAFTRDASRARGRFPSEVEVLSLGDISPAVMSRLDAVVNLAGEPVVSSRRWTDASKAEILRSRVETTRAVVDAMSASSPCPSTLVSASGVGFYGPRGDEEVDEQTPSGDDFLAEVCRAWEGEAERAAQHGARVVTVRLGVVLGDEGGALDRMLPAFKMFVGGPVGSGRQYFPWIHLDDAVGMLLFALDRGDMRGALNGTAPAPVRFEEFARELGAAMKRPSWFPVPGFVLRAVMGEMAQVLLTGQRAVPRAALTAGYRFKHPRLREALHAVFEASRER